MEEPQQQLLQSKKQSIPQLKKFPSEIVYDIPQKIKITKGLREWMQSFRHTPFDLNELDSEILNANPLYQELKIMLMTYNKQGKMSEPKKHVFYLHLMNLLRGLLYNRDPINRQNQLERIHTWAQGQMVIFNPPTRRTPRMNKTEVSERDIKLGREFSFDNMNLSTQIETTDNSILKTEDPQPIMPSDSIRSQLRDYWRNNRTKHQGVDAPIQKLKEFHRRKLITPTPDKKIQEGQNIKKIFPNVYSSIKPKENLLSEQQISLSRIPDEKSKTSLISEPRPYLTDYKDIYKRNIEFELPNMMQENHPKFPVLSLQWLKNNYQSIQDKKNDEEMIQIMNQWSKNKSRVQKEIQRRIDTREQSRINQSMDLEESKDYSQFLSKGQIMVQSLGERRIKRSRTMSTKKDNLIKIIDKSTVLPRKTSTQKYVNISFDSIENQMNQQKVQNMKQNYQKILGIKDGDKSFPYIPRSLSVYDRQKNNYHQEVFSSIIAKESPEKQLNEQLDEINRVKNRLAQHKIHVPIQKLVAAIMTPQFEQDIQDNELPQPGFGILDNPFPKMAKPRQNITKKRR